MWTTEGLQFLLELVTQDQSLPEDFWMGWATNASLGTSSVLSDITELSGNGYWRQPVAPGLGYAEGVLHLGDNPTDGDTVTLDGTTYRFKTTMALPNDVKCGATATLTQQSLLKTINGTGTVGVDYFAGTTTPHATVEMHPWDVIGTDDAVIHARTGGTGGNSIATTETFSSGLDCYFDDTTLGTYRLGGVDLTSAAGGVNGRALEGITRTWTASGGNWALALWVFLCTVETGSSGKLIAVEDLNSGSGVTLLDGTSYDVSMDLIVEPKVA